MQFNSIIIVPKDPVICILIFCIIYSMLLYFINIPLYILLFKLLLYVYYLSMYLPEIKLSISRSTFYPNENIEFENDLGGEISRDIDTFMWHFWIWVQFSTWLTEHPKFRVIRSKDVPVNSHPQSCYIIVRRWPYAGWYKPRTTYQNPNFSFSRNMRA